MEENKKVSHRVQILETINIDEGKSMVDYVDDLGKTIARAEEIRDAFNPRFEKVEKALEEIKTNDTTRDHRMVDTDNKLNKIETCLRSIIEQSHNILKSLVDNTKILISKLENEKGSLEQELDMEGMGDVQGPRTRTRGKKKEKKPNKEIKELKFASKIMTCWSSRLVIFLSLCRCC